MRYNPEIHNRQSIRLNGYDYAQPGAYFVTICTWNRECLFGSVIDNEMKLNKYGKIAKNCWLEIPNHFTGVQQDEFVVMPNHIHGIIQIHQVGARHAVPLQDKYTKTFEQFGKPTRRSIPTVIRSYKSVVTRQINIIQQTPGIPVWQRNYYEHIIRNEIELNRLREYILDNPLKRVLDENNPYNIHGENI